METNEKLMAQYRAILDDKTPNKVKMLELLKGFVSHQRYIVEEHHKLKADVAYAIVRHIDDKTPNEAFNELLGIIKR